MFFSPLHFHSNFYLSHTPIQQFIQDVMLESVTMNKLVNKWMSLLHVSPAPVSSEFASSYYSSWITSRLFYYFIGKHIPYKMLRMFYLLFKCYLESSICVHYNTIITLTYAVSMLSRASWCCLNRTTNAHTATSATEQRCWVVNRQKLAKC